MRVSNYFKPTNVFFWCGGGVYWSKDLWPFYVVFFFCDLIERKESLQNWTLVLSLFRMQRLKAMDEVVGAVEAQLKKLRTIAMLDIPATGPWGVRWVWVYVDLRKKTIWFSIDEAFKIYGMGWNGMCMKFVVFNAWHLLCLYSENSFKGASRMLFELVLSKIEGRIGPFSVPTPNVADV